MVDTRTEHGLKDGEKVSLGDDVGRGSSLIREHERDVLVVAIIEERIELSGINVTIELVDELAGSGDAGNQELRNGWFLIESRALGWRIILGWRRWWGVVDGL